MPDFSIEISHAISRDEVRQQLPHLRPPLRMIAEDWLAESTTIDFITLDPAGHVALLLIGQAGEDAALLTRALAHRAWVAARLGNWRQLAPDLGVAADAQVRAVLLCPSFAPETLAAAEGLQGAIQPVLCCSSEANGEHRLVFESLSELLPGPAPKGPPATPAVQHRLAPCAAEVEAAPLMVYNAARLRESGLPFRHRAAMAKWFTAPRTAPRGRPSRVEAMPFRSGLTEEDLGLTPEEVHEFS